MSPFVPILVSRLPFLLGDFTLLELLGQFPRISLKFIKLSLTPQMLSRVSGYTDLRFGRELFIFATQDIDPDQGKSSGKEIYHHFLFPIGTLSLCDILHERPYPRGDITAKVQIEVFSDCLESGVTKNRESFLRCPEEPIFEREVPLQIPSVELSRCHADILPRLTVWCAVHHEPEVEGHHPQLQVILVAIQEREVDPMVVVRILVNHERAILRVKISKSIRGDNSDGTVDNSKVCNGGFVMVQPNATLKRGTLFPIRTHGTMHRGGGVHLRRQSETCGEEGREEKPFCDNTTHEPRSHLRRGHLGPPIPCIYSSRWYWFAKKNDLRSSSIGECNEVPCVWTGTIDDLVHKSGALDVWMNAATVCNSGDESIIRVQVDFISRPCFLTSQSRKRSS